MRMTRSAFSRSVKRRRYPDSGQILERVPRFGPAHLEKAKYHDRSGDPPRAISEAKLALSSESNDLNSPNPETPRNLNLRRR
jgi:hypothetical protein